VLLPSDTHRKSITSIKAVLLPFVTYLLTLLLSDPLLIIRVPRNLADSGPSPGTVNFVAGLFDICGSVKDRHREYMGLMARETVVFRGRNAIYTKVAGRTTIDQPT
jgi:hypothetical protein